MIIDHNHKYIFISVPKTGSISIQFSLGYGDNIPEPDLYHQGIKTALDANPTCVNYFKFAFVRNPWERLVSLYNDFTLKRVHQYSGKIRHEKPLLSEFTNFEDLCLKLPESPWASNVFFKTQWDQLSIDGQLMMDIVGRFENFAGDFKTICQRIGLVDVKLLEMNKGVHDKAPYRQYYSGAARDAVAKIYRDDIERFNYDF